MVSVLVAVEVVFVVEEACFAAAVVVYFVVVLAAEVYFAEAFVPYLEGQLVYKEKVTRSIAEDFQILLVLFQVKNQE